MCLGRCAQSAQTRQRRDQAPVGERIAEVRLFPIDHARDLIVRADEIVEDVDVAVAEARRRTVRQVPSVPRRPGERCAHHRRNRNRRLGREWRRDRATQLLVPEAADPEIRDRDSANRLRGWSRRRSGMRQSHRPSSVPDPCAAHRSRPGQCRLRRAATQGRLLPAPPVPARRCSPDSAARAPRGGHRRAGRCRALAPAGAPPAQRRCARLASSDSILRHRAAVR